MTTRMAVVQMQPTLKDRAGNLATITARLREACERDARLVLFPEAAVTGYCLDSRDEALAVAEEVPGETVAMLTPVCREHDAHAVVGTLEREGDRLFNVALLIGPDGLRARYRKMHLPYLGVDRFATPGAGDFAVHEVGDLRVGMLICYDGGFPEAVRCLALAGADVVVLPTNWPSGAECAARHATNVRAWENTIYFAAANRVGVEGGYFFIGGSSIADPAGTTIAAAPHNKPTILYADIDPMRSRNKTLERVPGKDRLNRMEDRRPDIYGALVGK